MIVGWCPTGEIEDLTIVGLVIPLTLPRPSDQDDNTTKQDQDETSKQADETLKPIRSVMLQQDHHTLHPPFPTAAEPRAQRVMDTLAICFGYNSAVVRAEKKQLIALSYRWLDNPSPVKVGVGDVYKCVYERYDATIPPVMSEFAGRVVEFSTVGHVVVHEFMGRPQG